MDWGRNTCHPQSLKLDTFLLKHFGQLISIETNRKWLSGAIPTLNSYTNLLSDQTHREEGDEWNNGPTCVIWYLSSGHRLDWDQQHVESLCWHDDEEEQQEDTFKYSYFFVQVEELQTLRDQLLFSGFSSEVKPLSSEKTGSDWQRPAGHRSEGAVWFSTESNLSTGESEVRHHVLMFKVQCVEFSDI